MTKTVGVLVAMDKELELLVSDGFNAEEKGPFRFLVGDRGGAVLVVGKSGIGKVNAAACVQTMVSSYAPDFVLSIGVCGCLSESGVRQGEALVAKSVRYHDAWCGEPNEPGQVQGLPAEFQENVPGLGKDAWTEAMNASGADWSFGRLLSGDWFVDSESRARELLEKVPEKWGKEPVGVDMESGALAQVCWLNGVPFASVRVVSDCPLNPKFESYDGFWAAAPERLDGIVKSVVRRAVYGA